MLKLTLFLSFFIGLLAFGQDKGGTVDLLAEEVIPKCPYHYAYPEQHKVRIDSDKLGVCLAYAIQSTSPNYEFNRGQMTRPYRSSGFQSYLTAVYVPGANPPDTTAKFFQSGKEEQLKAWILTQPEHSIDPVSLLAEASKLNDGNVWNAVLTVHNLLRNNARAYHKARYDYNATPADVEKLFNKLIDLRGDLSERGSAFHGDHFGSWYRIWGVMLFRMESENEHPVATQCFANVKSKPGTFASLSRRFAHYKAKVASKLAEYKTVGDADEKKIEIDYEAVKASDTLINSLWPLSGQPQKPTPEELKACKDRNYLSQDSTN